MQKSCGRPGVARVSAIGVAGIVGAVAATLVWTRRAMRWGATDAEVASIGSAEDAFDGIDGRRVQMTRAVSIAAPPSTVWAWLAQSGRGAGWYSYEWLDNGGRSSAQHIVTWIPDPAVGDAAAIGYLRKVVPGRELVWWAPDDPILGARTWLAYQYTVAPEGDGSRLLMRVDLAASGAAARLPVLLVPLIDSIMATCQLRRLKLLSERFGARHHDPDNPESGERDQYQRFHVIYASGEEAGVPGAENARQARTWAEADGCIRPR